MKQRNFFVLKPVLGVWGRAVREQKIPLWKGYEMKRLLCAVTLAAAWVLAAAPFAADWKLSPETAVSGDVMEIRLDTRRSVGNLLNLPAKMYAGRLVQISGEFRGEKILKGGEYDGGKVIFSWMLDGRRRYLGIRVPTGSFGWKPFSRVVYIPGGAGDIVLNIGFQNSAGVFKVRNFQLKVLGMPLDFASKANMELTDRVANDGKGGWSDQGPANDGRSFQRHFRQNFFAGIPFRLIPDGRSVLTMKSVHFPPGPESVRFELPVQAPAKTLYLLHTLCWGPAPQTPVGTIEIRYADGKMQTVPLLCGRDAADWWSPNVLSNASPVCYGFSGNGGTVALYLSRFLLEHSDPVSVTFRSVNGGAVWIIAGATLCAQDLPLPEFKPYTAEPGKEWTAVKRFPKNRRTAGSALDVSGYLPDGTAGKFGRVVVRNGHFEFENAPGRKVRFFTCAVETAFRSKEDVDIFVKELRKNGYNMVRTHFYDRILCGNGKRELDFDPVGLDMFDYMVFAMKENGIYLNFDCMTSWNGYAPGNIWTMKDRNLKKNSIYFDPASRENWRKGVETILGRRNPYTGMRLIDDPVLALTVGFNEQEFGFFREFDRKLVAPAWRKFLQERYKTIGALKQAWGGKAAAYRSFEDVPCFSPRESLRNRDAALFLRKTESELFDWYCAQLREMGYKGLVTNYNMAKSLHYSAVRSPMDFVAMNSYHAHPGADRMVRNQSSSITRFGGVFRDIISTRLAGKPFLVTEHNHVFWNRYRYEQGLLIGAYAAFQDIDGLTVHAAPYSVQDPGTIRSFKLWNDPVNTASEFLTFFAFVRGDVKPSQGGVRVMVDADEMYRTGNPEAGLSLNQTRLALMTGFSSECTGKALAPSAPLGRNEVRVKQSGGSTVTTSTSGFSATADLPSVDGAGSMALLKQRNLLSSGNRSNGETVFESSTGELMLNAPLCWLSVNAPRLQGICSDPGRPAELADFRILSMSTPGCLAAVAVDGMKPLREAERIVIVYSTNALNSGMKFMSPDMTRLLKDGGAETVLRTGRFTVSLRNRNAAKLRLYPLDLAGNRLKMIAPEKTAAGVAQFTVDTAKDGASLFFEVAAER